MRRNGLSPMTLRSTIYSVHGVYMWLISTHYDPLPINDVHCRTQFSCAAQSYPSVLSIWIPHTWISICTCSRSRTYKRSLGWSSSLNPLFFFYAFVCRNMPSPNKICLYEVNTCDCASMGSMLSRCHWLPMLGPPENSKELLRRLVEHQGPKATIGKILTTAGIEESDKLLPGQYILDYLPTDPTLTIPQIKFEAWSNAKGRHDKEMASVELAPPVFFIRVDKGDVGVPLVDGRGKCSRDTFKGLRDAPPPPKPIRKEKQRQTIKLRMGFAGYEPYEAQIRVKQNESGFTSMSSLAHSVAQQVYDFTKTAQYKPGTVANDEWKFGNEPHEIQANNIILVGIVQVSGGAFMPILRLERRLPPKSNYHA
ncbi:hypothetical protein OF83DRAFT_196916 [Amylostereum chailletii]|nr:hypothetical protein OF83DRAFT_196916 [Amylostereum chailletii]